MSKSKSAKAKKRIVNYDSDTPRCATCKSFQRPQSAMRNSLPVAGRPPICKLHTFIVKVNGLCDTWKGTDGSTLDT